MIVTRHITTDARTGTRTGIMMGTLTGMMIGAIVGCGGSSSDDGGSSDNGQDAISDASGDREVGLDSSPNDGYHDTAPEDGKPSDAPSDTLLVDSGPLGFRHPGVLVNRAQLDLIKANIKAGAAPWKAAFTKASTSRYGSLTYVAKPRAIVECGSYSVPDNGCSDEMSDATAAYTHALLWYFTDDEAHAKKSAEIMDAWAAVLTDHTNSNAPLQSAWVASVFPRAAEILKATYPAFAAADAAKFGTLLHDVYLPKIVKGSGSNGNWELSMIEGTMAISVYLDDRSTFDGAVAMWRKRVPAYLYMTSDGATPLSPPGTPKSAAALDTFWYTPGKYVDGLCQETCRDFGHVQLGLAAMIDAAETARIQGVDLYADEEKRITTGLEFNAQYLDGVPNPGWLCGGTFTNPTPSAMWEIAYNEYATRLKLSLPHTGNLVTKDRPTGTALHMVWETLTHGDVGSVGLP